MKKVFIPCIREVRGALRLRQQYKTDRRVVISCRYLFKLPSVFLREHRRYYTEGRVERFKRSTREKTSSSRESYEGPCFAEGQVSCFCASGLRANQRETGP